MPPAMLSAMKTVVLDACVLYSGMLRDFLLCLAEDKVFLPFWSERIRDEWIRNLLRNRPDILPESLERTRRNMDAYFPHSLVRGYESLISTLHLPAEKDRHVLAVAICAKARYIITFNLKDFPQTELQLYGVEALSPDDFIMQLIRDAPILVLRATRKHRLGLVSPPLSVAEYLAMLENQGLPKTATFLRERETDI